MDIEQLTKVQIVLLTLLVSFVTSIATGIVTVSLMNQAPPSIAQTVNRVIERTVQTVIPAAQTSASAAVAQTTVVLKERDLISQSVAKMMPSVVKLYTTNEENPTFLGIGVVLDSAGTIVTDTSAIGAGADAVAALSDGTRARVFVSSRNEDLGVAYLTATSTADKSPTWTPADISVSHPALGETVVALSGNATTRVSDGIIQALQPATDSSPLIVETSIPDSGIMYGSPLVGTDGSLLGVSTTVSRVSNESGFIPAAALTKQAASQ